MTAPARFSQADIKRAIKAVDGLGYEEVCVSIGPDGRIEVTVRRNATNDNAGVDLE